LQQRLGPAVALLLVPVGAERVAAVVPDQRGRAEGERPALLPQAPAGVDVVTSGAEAGVEAADRFQRPAAVGHVAAGDVLRLDVVEEDVYRSARGVGDALRDRT